MGSKTGKTDIFDLIDRLPTSNALLWGIGRILLAMVICIVLWRHAGLEKPVGWWLESTSQWVADQVIEPVDIVSLQPSPENPDITVPTKSRAKVIIRAAAQSHQNFALLLPVVLLAAFPLKRFATTLPQMIFGMVFMGLFAVILNVTQSYILFNSYLEEGIKSPDIMKERLILLPINYIILPAVALYLSNLTVSNGVRFFTAKPKKALARTSPGREKDTVADHSRVGRNDPCPCGSGKKFKKCCGKASAA